MADPMPKEKQRRRLVSEIRAQDILSLVASDVSNIQ
jgi:hypothetical protein